MIHIDEKTAVRAAWRKVVVAKGNNGNYLQHSVEVAVAQHLSALSAQGSLRIALTHGMAPFEPCGALPNGQTRGLLRKALEAAQGPPTHGEAQIIAAYRQTNASLESYPNTGELLAATIGRRRLFGGITEVDPQRHAKLVEAWSGSGVTPANSSWRREIQPGGVLSSPPTLRTPWLFAADPMTFREDGYADDDKLYRADLSRLSATLKGFIASGQPGLAAVFVYSVKPDVRPQFWNFADDLAANCGASVVSVWLTHQGGNRNLAALLCSGVVLPDSWLPPGVCVGR
jgi:hypothetical protein